LNNAVEAANAANVARCIDILRKLLASHEHQLDLIDEGIEYYDKVMKFIHGTLTRDQISIMRSYSTPHFVVSVFRCG
jgi:hypothetical protein